MEFLENALKCFIRHGYAKTVILHTSQQQNVLCVQTEKVPLRCDVKKYDYLKVSEFIF
jgi:hypothetical protein